jgi:RHS repeat-associated protein
MSDLDRYQYGYDRNSNRLYKANVVGTAAVGYLDEGYSYDNLNRLTQMQRGNLSSGVITGTPKREMDYTLDPNGNWSAYLTKTNGTTDLNQTRTANTVNEITAIGGTPAWATPPAYDAAGNMTSFPQPTSPTSTFIATYDAWNRMTSINTSGGAVATYQYDGRGRRIVKHTAATSETRHFYYTNTWQDIEERTGTSTSMDKQYVWGVRYIDELVCRDDATPQRLYAMQDANFTLTSICNTSGGVVERYQFDPYGTRAIINGSWGTISTSAYDWVIGHQGLMQDVESGLVYNRARSLLALLGLFVSRDAFFYGDGLNLYEVERSAPLILVDPSGNSYCCCAEDIKITNVKRTHYREESGVAVYGHKFNTEITVSYKDTKDASSNCQLAWMEMTNVPYFSGMKANKWQDMTQNDATKDSFKNWPPTPSTKMPWVDTDEPHIKVGDSRVLRFNIIVYSSEDCCCSKNSVNVTAWQVLDSKDRVISKQQFDTPDPGTWNP